jgi:hypothetical protein
MVVLVQNLGPVFCFFYPEYLMLLDPIMGFISDNTDLFKDGAMFL